MRRWPSVLLVGVVTAVTGCSSEQANPGTSSTAPATTLETTTTSSEPAATTSAPPTTAEATTTTTVAPVETMVVAVYFMRDGHVATVHRTVPKSVGTSRAALGELLAGPTAEEVGLGMATAIPSDTVLNGVRIEGGIAIVDLSGAYEAGGGTLAMMSRLAQVVYTLTQFATVDGVRFELDGELVDMIGGEGIIVDTPQTRANFEELTPFIFVESPAPFDAVASPLRVFGTSNVFEATFMVRLTDPNGTVLYEHFQMATSGTGTRGTYDFIIDFTLTVHGTGQLRLWEPSSMDGSDTNVVEIPIEM